MSPTRFFPLALAALLPAAADAQQPRSDRLTLDHYLEWEDVAGPQLSPDGSSVVYTRRWVDKMNDRWESSLWIMNADGSRHRFLVDGSSARWSPDGTRLAFVARGEPEGSQIFVRWMDEEGAVSQITRVTESPENLRWSPDGRSLAFDMLVPSRKSWQVDMPDKPEGAKWTEAPRIIESMDYRQDRVGFLEEGSRHIFVVPADGGTPRQVTSGDWDHENPEWTPDGRSILFSTLRTEDADHQWRESEIYAVDVAGGAIRQLTSRRGPDFAPRVSPDGRRVAFVGYDWTDDTYIEAKLYVMGIDGSGPRLIAEELGRTPGVVEWAEDGSGVYFNAQVRGTQNLFFAPLNGAARPVTQGEHMLDVTDIARGRAVGTLSAPQDPSDVVAFDLRRPGELRELTQVNADVLAGVKLGEVEEIWYSSVDDLRIHGWIVKPPNFDPSRKYPLMLSIHGGPHGMYGVGFNFGWQNHAAQDYLVLYTNPRGSAGYGSAFGNAIKYDYPNKDFNDLMAGVDAVIAKGYVDTDNMFVYGCSGGGVLTAWVVGHTDRFRAASSNCPVINWLSFVGTTDSPGWYRNFAKLPWEDPSEHLRRSPLMYVGNVKTPTMLMTGVRDLRTPIAQTEEFYQALKIMKVPTAMIRFNEEFHGTSSRPSNFIRTQLYLREWFERWGTHDDGARRATEPQ
jgi:dipeptidyl aminopeptidase/acylaminoacyl peptidase